ncbi:Ig-like domain-containing protein [Winogradskyella thalassocola]|uniref:Ig-like domain-containing protein n=1 Tax=Winogradskyella thalassocola TaxID=262004 RepID=UPI001587185C|nr:Ig-like domain-containing protein [Winogradskyella thalassocola]
MSAQQLAFPSALGAGSYTTGGRGGVVLHVTTLADSGEGSLRWALTDPVNKTLDRTIVFDVSGVIELETVIRMSDGYTGGITINGFTAPEGGITIIGQLFRMVDASNVIIRGMKFRGGYNYTDPNNEYSKSSFLMGGTNGFIVDRCSSGFSLEQSIGGNGGNANDPFSGATFQNNLVGNSSRVGIIGQGITSDQSLRGIPTRVSYHRNVMVDCGWRTPNVAGNIRADIINNFVHNWQNRTSSFTGTAYDGQPSTQKTQSNIIGNYYQAGTNSRNSGTDVLYKINDNNINPEFHFVDNFITSDVLKGKAIEYDYTDSNTAHNAFTNYPDGSSQTIQPNWFTYPQFPLLGEQVPILSSQDLKTELFDTVGACYYTDNNGNIQFYRDPIDTELILRAATNSIEAREGDYVARAESLLPGGSNAVPSETRPDDFYQSNPHIPEAWLISKGLTGTPTIHNDIAPSGYTWLEEYINQIDTPVNGINIPQITRTDSNPTTIELGGTYNTITGTWTDVEDGSGIATVGGDLVDVNTIGTYNVTLEHTDTDGNRGFLTTPIYITAEVVDATSVSVTPETVTLSEDTNIQLSVGFTPLDTTDQTGVWTSNNTNATVNANGLVTAISPGTSIITFTSNDGSFTDTSTITINGSVVPTDITFVGGMLGNLNWIEFDENTVNPTATLITTDPDESATHTYSIPMNNTDDYERFSISGDQLILNLTPDFENPEDTADNNIYALTVRSENSNGGIFDKFVLFWIKDVVDETLVPVSSVSVSPTMADLLISTTISLTATFNPGNATNQNGTWSSSDEAIATVDANGLVSPVSLGQVIITFTTSDGEFTDTSEITVFPEALNPSAGDDQQICEGESTTLIASGGTNYIWNTGETTDSIEVTPNTTTTYTVTVSDDNEQSEEANVTITVNALPVANAGEDQFLCEGNSTILTATGGTTYLWNTGETTATIEVSPTAETTYSVEVSDNNCFSSDDVTVFVNAAPEIIISEDVVIIEGESTTLTVSGSDTYEWNTGETTDSITVNPLITTTYTVSSIGPNGCVSNAEVTVTVIPEIIANAGDDETICSGETITLTALGGSNYTWNTGDLGSELIVTPTETTTYTVTAEDDYGYTDTDEITIFVNEVPNITVSENVFIMIGSSATLTANGGSTYSWSTGESSSEIIVSPDVTTTYTVTGFSENGCQSIEEVVVTVVEELVANAGEDISICQGESITLNASGGITYTWNTGETGATPTFTPTENTTYTVTVTDGFGNSDTDDVTITVNPKPTAYAGEDETLCQGESVVLTAEGGDSYLWNTGATTQSITVNPDEDITYNVEVFTNTCSDIDEVTVFVLPTPDLILSDAITIISGSSTTIEATGADSYLWFNGETTNFIEVNPLETTTYSVTGFSTNGCQITGEITVTVIPEVNADAGSDTSICIGESVMLTASGGTNFSWSTGETSASINISPIETTTYNVTVSDSFGNSDTDSVTVVVNELPSLTLTNDITILEGESINLSVSGAETYEWNTGETSSTINVSPTETTIYSVTGFSASGCQVIEETTVNVVPEVIANAGNDVSICIGESVTLNATGGSNYTWNTGDTSVSPTFTPTQTTTYTVTVTDSFGNSDTDSVTVTVNELPNILVSENITIVEGESASLSVSGAETYLWNTGATSNSILVSPTQTTTFNVIGITNTCSSELKEVTVIVTPLFKASAGTDERVCDNQDYEVVLTANQGDSYLWSTGETTQSIVVSPLSTSTYSVTVTLGEQTDTDDVKVYVDPSPDVVVANGDSVEILNGDFITLSASGANTYQWNNGATQPNIAVSPSTTTTYEVKGFIGECYDDKQVTVNVLQPVVADAGEDVLICLDDLTTLTASGGDDYVWSTGETTPTITVSPLETTDYTVTVFNALDFDEATVRVEVDVNCAIDSVTPSEEETEFEFDVYPNPASDIVNVKISGTLNVSDVNIYDVTGKLIKHSKITNENLSYSTTTQIGISTFQSGVYFVKLIDEDRVITKKLIVE